MAAFKCLGRILTSMDDNWPMVVTNLSKAKKNWVLISRILGQEGENAWKSRNFFKTVAQVVILFGLEIWLMTLHVSPTND